MEIIYHYLNGNDLKKVVTEANIEVIKKPDTNSHNSVEEVHINGMRGFLKKSIGENGNRISILDKYEYLVSKISELYGIKSAEEFLVNDQDSVYLFSKSVVDENETLVMASALTIELLRQISIPEKMIEEIKTSGASNLKDMIIKYNLPQETIVELSKLKNDLETLNLKIEEFRNGLERKMDNPNNKRFYVRDYNQMEFAINIFINKLNMLNINNKEEITRDYIRMCYFDALIGNKDRNVNNYGLVRNQDGSYKFAPLFDSATVLMPNTEENLWQINEYLIDRAATLKYIESEYPNYVADIQNIDISEIMTSMALDVLTQDEFEIFNKTVLNPLSKDAIMHL